MHKKPEVSVIIPALNEKRNIPLLLEKFASMIEINEGSQSFEVILVDDGSEDGTYETALRLQKKYEFLKLARHKRHRGITDALLSGFDIASGNIFVFFPADLQYLPEDIPKLVAKLKEGYDIVTGWKVGRYARQFVSGVYNFLSRRLFHIPVHDLNSIKAFRREVVEKLPWRKDWHRYMVVMAYEQGYDVAEVKVDVYPRRYGKSNFGFWRIPVGVLDLIAVKFQISFMKKPMLLFGSLGGVFTLVGVIVGIYALYQRFVLHHGYRPLGYLIVLLIVVGILFFVLGFLAETIAAVQDELRRSEKK